MAAVLELFGKEGAGFRSLPSVHFSSVMSSSIRNAVAPRPTCRRPRLPRTLQQRNARIEQYQQLVRPIALHYHLRCAEPLEDLVQVGLLGLLRAAELYSRQRQTPFDAFARPHIRGGDPPLPAGHCAGRKAAPQAGGAAPAAGPAATPPGPVDVTRPTP